ncbi:MAG: hypothetical protein ACD_56C00154G0001 [uncultured bacterium]|nr:MAG: hypothetical protein ACD_56C00154G0001 [uncultured bacterium]
MQKVSLFQVLTTLIRGIGTILADSYNTTLIFELYQSNQKAGILSPAF